MPTQSPSVGPGEQSLPFLRVLSPGEGRLFEQGEETTKERRKCLTGLGVRRSWSVTRNSGTGNMISFSAATSAARAGLAPSFIDAASRR